MPSYPIAARAFVEDAETNGIPLRRTQLDTFSQWRIGKKPVPIDRRARNGEMLHAFASFHVTATGNITLDTASLEAAGGSLGDVYAPAGMTIVSLEMPVLPGRVVASRANDGVLAESLQGLDPWWNLAGVAGLTEGRQDGPERRLARQVTKAAFYHFVTGSLPASMLPSPEHQELALTAVGNLEKELWRTDLWLDQAGPAPMLAKGSQRAHRWKVAEAAAAALACELLDLTHSLCSHTDGAKPIFVDNTCPVMLVPTERAYAFAKDLTTRAQRLVSAATHVASAPDTIPLVFACTGHQYGCATPV